MKSLISITPIASLLLQLVVIVAFQVAGFVFVQKQDWFVPFNHSNPDYNGTSAEEMYAASTIEDSRVSGDIEFACKT
jgi:hypothetical protein